jgi:signal transduction histidine kinase
MNAIINLSRLLLETPLATGQRDSLNKIFKSSQMLLGIINDILDYSKIEAGRLELDLHPFLLEDLLDQVRTLFGAAADSKGLELYISIDRGFRPVLPAIHCGWDRYWSTLWATPSSSPRRAASVL